MLVIHSRFHDYPVETRDSLAAALGGGDRERACFLVDERVGRHYKKELAPHLDPSRCVWVKANEEAKSFARLEPIFLELIRRGLNRSGSLVVVGGGVLQDIGCFIASVLARGLPWEYLPSTLLAQADSCIGSKSSINIGPYKNQIGTFHAPRRVLLIPAVLATLPSEEIRSGMGEIIKLQLLKGKKDFHELMADLAAHPGIPPVEILSKWCLRSLAVKKTYIEQDELDRGIRNLLNYGHTFGHAYEAVSGFSIPHGIAVILGILTATSVSAGLGMVPGSYFQDLRARLEPWHTPFAKKIKAMKPEEILEAISRDKKNERDGITCILTRGCGRMEKVKMDLSNELGPLVRDFIAKAA